MNVIVNGNSQGMYLEEITATNDQVLSGVTYNDSDGELQTGTMKNNGAYTQAVQVDGNYSSQGGYYSSINITGPTLSGNASTANVLNGKTFYSNSGTKQTGSMNNHGAVTANVSVGGTYTSSAGYYSSITINGPTLSGNATTAQVLSGSTFYSNSGTKRTGTMVNRGALSATFNNYNTTYQYKNTNAGYYTSIAVNATWAVQAKTLTINQSYVNSGYTATGYWGASVTSPTSNSFKIFTSGGYLWLTINVGATSGTATVVKVVKQS